MRRGPDPGELVPRCPFARWNPVKYVAQLDAMQAAPRAVFLHTNCGGPNLTRWFDNLWETSHKRLGSTFQVFGDGRIDQLCETTSVIYAQFEASEWAVSIETQDDAQPDRPWTPRQLDSIVRLVQWLHETHEIPLRLMDSSTDSGIGYHQQFPVHNKSAHNCPGPIRLNQLLHTILPRLTGQPLHPGERGQPTHAHVPAPVNRLPLPSGKFDVDTRTWQEQMLRRGWSGIVGADGIYGDHARKACLAFQEEKGLPATGEVDEATWVTTWTATVT